MGKLVDLTGMRFGMLVVLEFYERKKSYKYIWKCQCDCGNIAFVERYNLKSGTTKSCGCLRIENGRKKFKDITGMRFERLVAIEVDHIKLNSKNHSSYFWKCKCDCGNNTIVSISDLMSGHTKSCGCYFNDMKDEILKKAQEGTRKRRLSLTDEEFTKNLILREYRYGAIARGIEFLLTEEELFDFILSKKCFYCGNGPDVYINKNKRVIKRLGIDRIDSGKGYSIENCVPCCKRCNIGKMSESKEDFLLWIERIYDNLIRDKIII